MDQIGVVGCGHMGSGIAEVCTRAGANVLVVESSPQSAYQGRLDTIQAIASSLYAEFKERCSSPPLLGRMVDADLLGRKSGRGFYTYD